MELAMPLANIVTVPFLVDDILIKKTFRAIYAMPMPYRVYALIE